MRYFYIVRPSGLVTKVATNKKNLACPDCYKAIGCEWVQMVSFRAGKHQYTMVVDEEGKLTGQPFNFIATSLYANPYDCINGSAVIVKTQGWAPFTEEQAEVFEKEANIIVNDTADMQ